MRRLLIFSVAVSSDGIQPVRTNSLEHVLVPISVVNWYLNQNKFFKFGIVSKCFVYKYLIWYISKIWYIIGIFLSDGLTEILN